MIGLQHEQARGRLLPAHLAELKERKSKDEKEFKDNYQPKGENDKSGIQPEHKRPVYVDR